MCSYGDGGGGPQLWQSQQVLRDAIVIAAPITAAIYMYMYLLHLHTLIV